MAIKLLLGLVGILAIIIGDPERAPLDAVGLPKSSIAGLASTNERIRDAAIAELLRDGPVRLEEIDHAAETLQQILRMHRRLTTPHYDWRANHRISDEQLQEAADYFLKYDAIPWLLDGLDNPDVDTRWVVATTLGRMSPEAKTKHRRIVVERSAEKLSDPYRRVGDQTIYKETRFSLAVLTAELIGEPIEGADLGDGDWHQRGRAVAKRAQQWLADQGPREDQ